MTSVRRLQPWPLQNQGPVFAGSSHKKKLPVVVAGLTMMATLYTVGTERLQSDCPLAPLQACSEALDKKLTHPDSAVRQAALEALLASDADSILKLGAVAKGLEDVPEVREVALEGTAQLRGSQNVPPDARQLLGKILENRPYSEPYETVDVVRWMKVSYDGGKTTSISPIFDHVTRYETVVQEAFHHARSELARWVETQG